MLRDGPVISVGHPLGGWPEAALKDAADASLHDSATAGEGVEPEDFDNVTAQAEKLTESAACKVCIRH